jgi:hypothetical protein
MSTAPSEARVSALEATMLELARAQVRTEGSIDRLADEMRTFKDGMRTFKDEMRASERKIEAQRVESNKRWGELSNKMGTLVEDIIYPSISEIFKRAFGQDHEPDCSIRVRRHHREDLGRMREFDAVASGGGIFMINETRSRLVPEAIPAFVEILRDARPFFPEAEGQKVVGALATFYADPSLVRNGERQGLLMLGLGSGLMQILNAPGFEPREF